MGDQGGHVHGHVVPGGLRPWGRRLADVDPPARGSPRSPPPDSGHGHRRQHAGEQGSGTRGPSGPPRRSASIARPGAPGSAGTSDTWRMWPVPMTATWPSTRAALGLGLQHHRLRGCRQHPAPHPEEAAGLVERLTGPRPLHEAGQDQVAQRVAGQLASSNRSSKARASGDPGSANATRHLRRSPGRRCGASRGACPTTRRRRQPTRWRSRARCSERRPAGWPPARGHRRSPPPAVPRRRDPGGLTDPRPGGSGAGSPCAARSRESSSARTTERCRPPVHPMATVRYDFPSRRRRG